MDNRNCGCGAPLVFVWPFLLYPGCNAEGEALEYLPLPPPSLTARASRGQAGAHLASLLPSTPWPQACLDPDLSGSALTARCAAREGLPHSPPLHRQLLQNHPVCFCQVCYDVICAQFHFLEDWNKKEEGIIFAPTPHAWQGARNWSLDTCSSVAGEFSPGSVSCTPPPHTHTVSLGKQPSCVQRTLHSDWVEHGSPFSPNFLPSHQSKAMF